MSSDRQRLAQAQSKPPYFVGVDVGGTNLKVGVVDDQGESLAYESIPTNPEQGPDEAVRRLAAAIAQVTEWSSLTKSDIMGVGLATPGTMDIPAGMLLEPPNLPSWEHFPIRQRLSEACGLPVTFTNDANAAAYGEYWVGSGRQHNSIVLFTLGTGVGCGIIVGGMAIEGEHSHGAECGHIIIDYSPTALVCSCGRTGHLEAYASATGVIRRAEAALASGQKSTVADRVANGDALTPLLIYREAESGDAFSLELILQTARYLGIGVVTLMHTIDPNAVILGGAMNFGGQNTELGRRFLGEVRAEVHRRAFPVCAENTAIEFAALGSDAGYLGAAGIARHAYQNRA